MKSPEQIYYGLKRHAADMLQLHPVSDPYVSGDGFRELADHTYDKDSQLTPEKVNAGDTIFVSSPYLRSFFENAHERVPHPYVLLSHNGDTNIDQSYARYLDQKIIHWFGQNVLITHPRVTPLPIGLENRRFYQNGRTHLFDSLRSNLSRSKTKTLLYGFNTATNPVERSPALTILQKLPFGVPLEGWPRPGDYLETLASSRFVASPPGNGVDCHRTWEALYLNTIPIVKKSTLTEYFYDQLELPLLLIQTWEELASYTEESLRVFYDQHKVRFDNPALWMPYWKQRIITLEKHL